MKRIFFLLTAQYFYIPKIIEQRFVMEGQVQIQLYNIQWMYNPHHNININISYNLQPDKITKPIPAKRNSKQLKAQKVQDKSCDIQIKYNHKNNESNPGKNQGQRVTNERKKSKVKKPINMQRNSITPDIFNERRIKTQGPFGQNDNFSAFKKDNKSKSHNKSVQQPVNKASHSTKKSQSFVKTNKSLKTTQTHLKSYIVPNSKKISIEELDHNYSQVGSITIKKRRAQSSFIRNDKVVAGLLNVSILASQLGSSQPITSERRHNDSSQSRNFKEFMSSIDMRIINKMQNDVPVFADKKQNSQRDIIRRIMSFKNISLEQLTKKVIIIQRFLKKKLKQKVVKKYKIIFKQITKKMGRSVKFNELSDISLSPQDQETSSIHNGLSLFQNQGIISADQSRHKRKNSSSSDELDKSDIKFDWLQKKQDKESRQRSEGLNIKKYKELVNEQVNKKVANIKNKFIEKYKEEANQSKKTSNQMFNFWNDRGGIDLQLINEQLVKQSKNHQLWIQNDLDTTQRLQQNNGEDSSEHYVDSAQKQDLTNLNYQKNKSNLLPLKTTHKNAFRPQQSQDQEQQQDLYDKNKYLSQSQQNSKESISERDFSIASNLIYPKNEFSSVEPLSVQKIIVDKPNQQIAAQQVVPNYLDCELNGFGINTNSQLLQLPKTSQQSFLKNQNQQNFLLDQSIGAKFEPVDYIILPKDTNEQELEIYQKIAKAKGNHRLIDQVVQIIGSFMISQFASDISVILRRTNGPPVEKKPQPPRNQGIPTSFNSVKNYLQHFIAFIKKQGKYLQKIYQNINKDIGPTSLQILTYLRPEPEESHLPVGVQTQEEIMQDQQGLFVISAQIFQQFQAEIEKQNKKQNKKQLTQRMKAFLSFWHRCIFQSFNQCLDYERPYGIQGKPYVWTAQQKKFRKIQRQKITFHLQKAENRLLDLTLVVGGLIFQKFDSPFLDADLSEQQKHMMNEERLSRILATELLQSESSWINYNDELAQLLVELTRVIEQKILFQHATQLKKMQRRRKMIAQQSANYQTVIFNLEQL